MIKTSYSEVALTVWEQHKASCGLDHYAGIVSLQALARLAKIMKSEEVLNDAKAHIKPFCQGNVPKAGGVYGDPRLSLGRQRHRVHGPARHAAGSL